MSRIFKIKDSWYLDFKYGDKRIRKSVGKDKKTAELILKDIDVKKAKGEYLGIVEEQHILFENFAKEYLEYAKLNKAQSTYRADYYKLTNNLLPYFKGKYLNQIDAKLIEQYKSMRIVKVKGATVNRDLELLKHFFTKAIDFGYVIANPAKGVKFFKESQGRTRFLNKFEKDALLKECPGLLKTMVLTAMLTGLRRGELVDLKWQDIDPLNREITLTQTKNNRIKHIPIKDILFDDLMSLPRYCDYVFANPNGSKFSNLRKQFEAAVKRANLSGVCWYTLRHTFASDLAMSGAGLRTIADLLGDRTLSMVMRYSHLSRNHLREAIDKLDSINGKNMAKMAIDPVIDIDGTSDKILKNQTIDNSGG